MENHFSWPPANDFSQISKSWQQVFTSYPGCHWKEKNCSRQEWKCNCQPGNDIFKRIKIFFPLTLFLSLSLLSNIRFDLSERKSFSKVWVQCKLICHIKPLGKCIKRTLKDWAIMIIRMILSFLSSPFKTSHETGGVSKSEDQNFRSFAWCKLLWNPLNVQSESNFPQD